MKRWVGTVSLLVVVGSIGCDGIKSGVQGLIYEEVDRSVTPTQLREQEEGRLEEVEPNDRLEDATAILLQREMQPLFGAIDPVDDVDWFVLTNRSEEDWIVELTVRPEGSDLNLALYLVVDGPGDHAPLLYDLGGSGEPESVPMLRVPAGGRQAFFLSGVDETKGEYRIQVRRRLSAGAVAVEPNDYPGVASKLSIPGEVQGFYDRPHDRDVFFVPAESLETGVYRLELSQIAGLEQRLQIFGSAELQNPLLEVHVRENRPAVIPNISLHGGGGEGLYFVLTAGEEFDRERSYRLRVIEHPPAQGFTIEREPNDRAEAAQLVRLGERVRGYLHTPGDRDHFRFVIEGKEETEEEEEAPPVDREEDQEELEELEEEPEVIDLWAGVPQKESPSHVVQVHLRPLGDFHRLGMRWIPGESTGEIGRGLEAESEEAGIVLCNQVLGAGEYGVEARALETKEGFRPGTFDYEIEFLNIAGMKGLEVEPNDSLSTADRIAMGSERVGFISSDGDVDFYAFVVGPEEIIVGGEVASAEEGEVLEEEQEGEAGEGETVDGEREVAVAGAAMGWEAPKTESVQVRLRGNRLNLGFELLDDEGGRIANVNRAGPGGDEELTIDLPHGLYYLAISASAGGLCEPYRIEVRTR